MCILTYKHVRAVDLTISGLSSSRYKSRGVASRKPQSSTPKQNQIIVEYRLPQTYTIPLSMEDTGGGSLSNLTEDRRPYKCQVDVKFPSQTQAKRAVEVISVDGELGDKVVKTFSLVAADERSERIENNVVVMRV